MSKLGLWANKRCHIIEITVKKIARKSLVWSIPNYLFNPELVTVVVVDAFFIAAGLVDDIPE